MCKVLSWVKGIKTAAPEKTNCRLGVFLVTIKNFKHMNLKLNFGQCKIEYIHGIFTTFLISTFRKRKSIVVSIFITLVLSVHVSGCQVAPHLNCSDKVALESALVSMLSAMIPMTSAVPSASYRRRQNER